MLCCSVPAQACFFFPLLFGEKRPTRRFSSLSSGKEGGKKLLLSFFLGEKGKSFISRLIADGINGGQGGEKGEGRERESAVVSACLALKGGRKRGKKQDPLTLAGSHSLLRVLRTTDGRRDFLSSCTYTVRTRHAWQGGMVGPWGMSICGRLTLQFLGTFDSRVQEEGIAIPSKPFNLLG